MKVWLWRMLICLAMGLLMTVFVSWAITLNARYRTVGVSAPPGVRVLFNSSFSGVGYDYTSDVNRIAKPDAVLTAHRMAVGLPFRAMVMTRIDEYTGESVTSGAWRGLPLPARLRGRFFDALPYTLLPGFFVNVLLFAAAARVLWMAPSLVSRAVRRRGGLCAACGYDLRGSVGGICPECGK